MRATLTVRLVVRNALVFQFVSGAKGEAISQNEKRELADREIQSPCGMTRPIRHRDERHAAGSRTRAATADARGTYLTRRGRRARIPGHSERRTIPIVPVATAQLPPLPPLQRANSIPTKPQAIPDSAATMLKESCSPHHGGSLGERA
jgi:hypothetical protein